MLIYQRFDMICFPIVNQLRNHNSLRPNINRMLDLAQPLGRAVGDHGRCPKIKVQVSGILGFGVCLICTAVLPGDDSVVFAKCANRKDTLSGNGPRNCRSRRQGHHGVVLFHLGCPRYGGAAVVLLVATQNDANAVYKHGQIPFGSDIGSPGYFSFATDYSPLFLSSQSMGSHSSTLLPSGSMIQANLPFSCDSGPPTSGTPPCSSCDTISSMLSTR